MVPISARFGFPHEEMVVGSAPSFGMDPDVCGPDKGGRGDYLRSPPLHGQYAYTTFGSECSYNRTPYPEWDCHGHTKMIRDGGMHGPAASIGTYSGRNSRLSQPSRGVSRSEELLNTQGTFSSWHPPRNQKAQWHTKVFNVPADMLFEDFVHDASVVINPNSEVTTTDKPKRSRNRSMKSMRGKQRTVVCTREAGGTCTPCLYWFYDHCKKGRRCDKCHILHAEGVYKSIRPSKQVRALLFDTPAARGASSSWVGR